MDRCLDVVDIQGGGDDVGHLGRADVGGSLVQLHTVDLVGIAAEGNGLGLVVPREAYLSLAGGNVFGVGSDVEVHADVAAQGQAVPGEVGRDGFGMGGCVGLAVNDDCGGVGLHAVGVTGGRGGDLGCDRCRQLAGVILTRADIAIDIGCGGAAVGSPCPCGLAVAVDTDGLYRQLMSLNDS